MSDTPTKQSSSTATPTHGGVFALGAFLLRLLPSLGALPMNFAPVGGLAVFGGARLRSWLAYALPLAVMVATDLVLWQIKGDWYSPLHWSRPAVYGSYLIYVMLGRWLGTSVLGIGAAAALGSVQFFLITNFASWLLNPEYTHDLTGLMLAYAAGLPFYNVDQPWGFFLPTLMSDLCFAYGFLAVHALWVQQTTTEGEVG